MGRARRWLALTGLVLGLLGVDEAYGSWHYHSFVGSRVLLIGDSHTVLSSPHTAYASYDVDARPGRRSTGAFEILDQYLSPRHRKVVFDVGTNDSAIPWRLRRNLARVWGRLGQRRLVLVTCWRVDGGSTARVNRVLRRFHGRHRGRTGLVRWGAIAKRRPSLFLDDGVHFTPAGYARRARLLKRRTRQA